MKVKIEDLKKAVDKAYADMKDLNVEVKFDERTMVLEYFDRGDSRVEIDVHEEGRMTPKIRRTEPLG